MNYRYVTDSAPVIDYLSDTLVEHLQKDEKVLWLLSGGSNILTELEISKILRGKDLHNLSVSLIDERYGDVGHVNENWQQLIDAGFELTRATLYRPLNGTSREDTAKAFDDWLGDQFGQTDYSIGLLGVGTDGHTAGIKPGSVAVNADGWVTDYQGEDFERITVTFDALRRLNEIVVQALGPDKSQVIRELLHADIPLSVQPAQVLKQAKSCTLFTDYKEENL